MHERIQTALTHLPRDLAAALTPYVSRADFAGWLSHDEAVALQSACNMTSEALALALLPLAAAYSVAPISAFYVGAVAKGVSGNLYFGANMEFAGAAMQQTVHAEQSAITHAWIRGEKALSDITINYSPCGHCRQFMNELNAAPTLNIHLPARTASKLHDYLPEAFGPRDLNITTLLMDSQTHQLSFEKYADMAKDVVMQQALSAANASHAPYSQSYSGVALQTASGQIYQGMYAENAAFNPSLPPLQAALINLNLSGENFSQITRTVLVQSHAQTINQQPATDAMLHALGLSACECVTV
ncbi:MAG: cytidine deaminase [Plesiomonas sp.]|uniref:cytidine deaminase n=1 Tax=Plesiomonas sp. TaxID=2486279 RepID=UPI003F33F2D0